MDLEKAYDRLRWDFISDTFMDVGLPAMFIELIMEFIETASLQILRNGYLSQLIGRTVDIRSVKWAICVSPLFC